VSPFAIFILRFISCALWILISVPAPNIVASQSSLAGEKPSEKQEDAVQTQMNNVRFHFSDNVQVEIKTLNGELVPLGNNEFPVFDDKTSFNLRITTARITIDSSNLANLLNSYVFAGPHSPLTELSDTIENGRLKVKGKLHDKGGIPFEMEGTLTPTPDGKLRLHSETIKALHVPVKGLIDLFGIDLGGLIKEGKVPGILAEGDDLILDLELILPAPHIEGKVASVRIEGENIIQEFGDSDRKPVKHIRAGNYMAFRNNRLRFGKLLMNDADLILMDMDPGDPLDFFLDHYKEQVSAGYTKITPDFGLRVFIKDYEKLHPAKSPATGDNTN
jgi:hypothetical protein